MLRFLDYTYVLMQTSPSLYVCCPVSFAICCQFSYSQTLFGAAFFTPANCVVALMEALAFGSLRVDPPRENLFHHLEG